MSVSKNVSDWVARRENQFFVLGSGDETAGCQGSVATLEKDGIQLKLHLPYGAAAEHVILKKLSFNVGDSALRAALAKNSEVVTARKAASKAERARKKSSEKESPEEKKTRLAACMGVALSWRVLRDPKGWRIFVSFDLPDVKIVSIKDSGRIAVDLNADHLAVAEINRHGNVVSRVVIPLQTAGKTTHQSRSVIGDAVKQIVALAVKTAKPIAVEDLDFSRKKATMREDGGHRYARMLSGLAYAATLQTLHSRSFDVGIEVFSDNPAYTSLIGEVLFQRRYGMSRHQAAAVAIGRRSMKFREQPPSSLQVTLPSTCKDRGKHVWRKWAVVAKQKAALTALSTSRKATSSPTSRGARREKPGSKDAGQVTNAGATPVGESYPPLFGVRPCR